MDDIPVGTRVMFSDHPLAASDLGTIAEPTAEEIAYARQAYDKVGPSYGHVLVQWDDDGEGWDRSWQEPTDLLVVAPAGEQTFPRPQVE